MDVLKIESRLMADKISKLIGKEVFKKFKYNVEIQVNNLNISLTDKMGRVHLDVNAEICLLYTSCGAAGISYRFDD